MLDDQGPRGSGLRGITHEGYGRLMTGARRRAGTRPAPGSALIAVAAWLLALTGGGALFVSFSAQYAYILAVRRQDAASVIEALLLDLLMIVFTLLALGLSRAGQSARAERALILLCAAASAYMNVSAADLASPRSVTAYAVAPIALAIVVDRTVAVIRRHVLAGREPSAWAPLGRITADAANIIGLVLLYCLRFALAAPETARGLPGWCSTPPRCLHSPRRRRLRQPAHPGPRRRSCSPCTAPTRTTGTAAQPAGSPPSWPHRPGSRREPPAPTCTPNWTAGHHDHAPAC
jgi:Protein of unknown function (DUF2637)